jgi:hypothetical protein
MVNSLARRGCGPVGLPQTQKVGIKSEKPTKAARVGCIDSKRLVWDAGQTRRRRLAMTAFDPRRTWSALNSPVIRMTVLQIVVRHTRSRAMRQKSPQHGAGDHEQAKQHGVAREGLDFRKSSCRSSRADLRTKPVLSRMLGFKGPAQRLPGLAGLAHQLVGALPHQRSAATVPSPCLSSSARLPSGRTTRRRQAP